MWSFFAILGAAAITSESQGRLTALDRLEARSGLDASQRAERVRLRARLNGVGVVVPMASLYFIASIIVFIVLMVNNTSTDRLEEAARKQKENPNYYAEQAKKSGLFISDVRYGYEDGSAIARFTVSNSSHKTHSFEISPATIRVRKSDESRVIKLNCYRYDEPKLEGRHRVKWLVLLDCDSGNTNFVGSIKEMKGPGFESIDGLPVTAPSRKSPN
ncbi:hypothetical protein GCM10010349_23060 [Streptomyces flavofungini]|nr:hypothetical protein GCM10010349_23060 [Streptomyces flavofungini]